MPTVCSEKSPFASDFNSFLGKKSEGGLYAPDPAFSYAMLSERAAMTGS